MKVYQYEKCSTCRKALAFLKTRGVAFESVPIVESPPAKAELREMLGYLGGDIRKLFNTSGLLYREMKLGEKLKTMTHEQAIDLLSKHGKLVKRPFALARGKGIVGFKQEDWEKFLRA